MGGGELTASGFPGWGRLLCDRPAAARSTRLLDLVGFEALQARNATLSLYPSRHWEALIMASFTGSVYDPMWSKSKRNARLVSNKAVIAARFEDCSQKLQRFAVSMISHIPEAQTKAFDDLLSDFVAWGNETGAKDQSLDYRLRKAKDLHESVVETLKELQDDIEFGKLLVS
jgi:hypothetical protein